MQFFLHYFLHLIFPAAIAYTLGGNRWKKLYLILLATMLVDLDHLLATPVFSACRCSMNFHPLHSYYAIAVYFFGLFFRKTRWWSAGLLLHMATDGLDCYLSLKTCA